VEKRSNQLPQIRTVCFQKVGLFYIHFIRFVKGLKENSDHFSEKIASVEFF